MVNHGSLQHQKLIEETIIELRKEGYHVINTNGISPDAIATKDNKLYAIEVLLLQSIPKKGWENNTTVRQKKESYSMFDDVIFKINNRDIKILTNNEKEQIERQKKAKKIVQDFIDGKL